MAQGPWFVIVFPSVLAVGLAKRYAAPELEFDFRRLRKSGSRSRVFGRNVNPLCNVVRRRLAFKAYETTLAQAAEPRRLPLGKLTGVRLHKLNRCCQIIPACEMFDDLAVADRLPGSLA